MQRYVPGEQQEGELRLDVDMPKDLKYIPFNITEDSSYDETASTILDTLLSCGNSPMLLQTDGRNVKELLDRCVAYACHCIPLHCSTFNTTRHVEHTWLPITNGLRPLMVQWVKHGRAVLLSREPLPVGMPNIQKPHSRRQNTAHGLVKQNNQMFRPNLGQSKYVNKTKNGRGYDGRCRRDTASIAEPYRHGGSEHPDDSHHEMNVPSRRGISRNLKAEQRTGARPRTTKWNGASAANSESSTTFQSQSSRNSATSLGNQSNEPLLLNDHCSSEVSSDNKRRSYDVRLDNSSASNTLSLDSRRTGINRRDNLHPTITSRQSAPYYDHNFDDHNDSGYPDHKNDGCRWDRKGTDCSNTTTAFSRGRGNRRGGRGSQQQRNYEFERRPRTSENRNVHFACDSDRGDSSLGVSAQPSPSNPSNNEPMSNGAPVSSLGDDQPNCTVKADNHDNGKIGSSDSGRPPVVQSASNTTPLDSNKNVADHSESVVNGSASILSVASSSNVTNNPEEADLVDRFQTLNTLDSDSAVKSHSDLSSITETTERSDHVSEKKSLSYASDTEKGSYANQSVADHSQNDKVSPKAAKRNSGGDSRGRRRKRSSKSDEPSFSNRDNIRVC